MVADQRRGVPDEVPVDNPKALIVRHDPVTQEAQFVVCSRAFARQRRQSATDVDLVLGGLEDLARPGSRENEELQRQLAEPALTRLACREALRHLVLRERGEDAAP